MILGLIGRAKSGKTDAARAIAYDAARGGFDTKIYEISQLVVEHCVERGYLPNKRREDLTPEEVSVLVDIGQAQRDIDSGFWIRQIEQAYHRDKPQVAIIPNLRAANECEMVARNKGYTILIECLNPNGSPHISMDRDANHPLESDLLNWNADFFIKVKRGQPALLAEQAVTLFQYLSALEDQRVPDYSEQLSFDLHQAWS